ncbi:MAG: helix-turn-helix domain-containing protein [Lachnospiraceae bacterium]
MSAVFRVNKTKDFTVMANHHLRNTNLSLRAKGLLSLMVSLPESWDYSLVGLSKISKEGVSAISSTLKELEKEGYLTRQRMRNMKGHLTGTEYTIYEQPISVLPNLENPNLDNPELEKPKLADHVQSNTDLSSTNISNIEGLNIYPSITLHDPIDRKAVIQYSKKIFAMMRYVLIAGKSALMSC